MTTPTITETTRRAEVTFRYALDSAEPRAVPHTQTGARYRPTWLTVSVVNGRRSGSPVLGGPRLKKSGSDGTQVHRECLYSPPDYPGYVLAAIERAESAVRKTNKETA